MTGTLAPALVLGLVGSAHCIGMCGPLALAVPSAGRGWSGRLAGGLLLNGGRVVTYMLLGGLFGTFGRGLALAGVQQSVSITLGVLILAGMIAPALVNAGWLSRGPATLVMRLQGIMARQLRRTSPGGLFITGLLNGLLPCGLVYLAVAGALATNGALEGAAFMTVFGLATWPALLAVRLGGGALSMRWRGILRRATPYVIGAMALLFILRGMGLGIPYVSPELHAPMAVEGCP